jgi:peptidoglycan/LPS O-acetylase OafA/YrhL
VLVVVLYHFSPDVMPGGFLGVDLFFVLSGFLITSLLVKEWDGTRTISLRTFWLRRARRLVPALLLLLLAVGIYSLVIDDQVDGQRFAVDGLASLGYVANWHFIASGQSYIDQFLQGAVSPLRHMWSLAIEEQFYLFWPLIVIGVAKLTGGRGARSARASRQRNQFRRALLALCTVLGLLSFVRMVMMFSPGGDINRVYYGTDSRAFIILIGAVLAALTWGAPVVARRWQGRVVVVGCVAAVGLAVALLSVTAETAWLYEGGYGLVALAMVAVLFAAAQPCANPIARLLGLKPLVGLGLISYGVYLWHWPISLWLDEANTGLDGVALFAVRAVVTLTVSLASYKLLEMPIRTGRISFRGSGRVVAALAAVVSVAVLLLVPALAFPSTRTAPTAAPRAADVVSAAAGYEAAPRCDGGTPLQPLDPDRELLVQHQGNSVGGEVRDCLGAIMAPAGVEFETVNPADWKLCTTIPGVKRQVRATKPDAAIFMAFLAFNNRCPETPWEDQIDELVHFWTANDVHVFLVPSPGFIVGTPQEQEMGTGPAAEKAHYEQLAAEDPEHVTVLDAGSFLRTDTGEYVWRMPCLPEGEAGCAPDGTIGVRYIDGLHFCTDPEFSGHGCIGEHYMGGQRRAASSLAVGLVTVLQELVAEDR